MKIFESLAINISLRITINILQCHIKSLKINVKDCSDLFKKKTWLTIIIGHWTDVKYEHMNSMLLGKIFI